MADIGDRRGQVLLLSCGLKVKCQVELHKVSVQVLGSTTADVKNSSTELFVAKEGAARSLINCVS